MFSKLKIGQRRYRPRLQPYTGWPSWLPLIDILFLMVLFIYVSKSFVQVSGFKVDLPRVSAPIAADMEKYIITVVPNGREAALIYYQDDRVRMEELPQRLFQLHDASQHAAVIIRADRGVPFDTVARIMAIAERAEVPSFIAVASPEDKPGKTFEP